MATSPERIRRALLRVTAAAQREVRRVAQEAPQEPAAARAALFATVPLIVNDYADGAAALALEWFEDLRDDARPSRPFTPEPFTANTEDDLRALVARSTEPLWDLERVQREVEQEFDAAYAETLARIEAKVQQAVAADFRETVTRNTARDSEAVGWQRFARPGGCKFCVMLAGRGAVYTEASVRFASHENCGCVAGPSYNQDAPRADVLQYQASKRKRTAAERAALRKYLNAQFPDAPG